MSTMRKLAFGYATSCNLRCAHCVATEDVPDGRKMGLNRAKEAIVALAQAGVGGMSFSAGEPFLFIDDIAELVKLSASIGIYTRIVTNCFWAENPALSDSMVFRLKEIGLSQLRLSFSRWHQKGVDRNNVLNAARSCRKFGVNYFVSFITDFSEEDDNLEQFLRDHGLMFFPEPVIYAGRADAFKRRKILTDYQPNCCDMNAYLTPDLDLYACCDVGSYFSKTHFFSLGSLTSETAEQLFTKFENDRLLNLIRLAGLSSIASFTGMRAREIITFSKCELCRHLFNEPETLAWLRSHVSQLEAWHR